MLFLSILILPIVRELDCFELPFLWSSALSRSLHLHNQVLYQRCWNFSLSVQSRISPKYQRSENMFMRSRFCKSLFTWPFFQCGRLLLVNSTATAVLAGINCIISWVKFLYASSISSIRSAMALSKIICFSTCSAVSHWRSKCCEAQLRLFRFFCQL